MSLRFNSATGRLWATDDTIPGDPVVWDTQDGLLFVDPNDVFSGSIEVPNRTASSQGVDGDQTVVDVEQDYFIGICSSPGSRYVRGLIRTTASAGGETMNGIWRQASGTHIDVLDAVSQTMVPQSDLGGFLRLATIGGYTFFVNELGHLVMRERIVARARDPGNPGTTFNRVRSDVTVDYRLMVGTFFGADFTVRPGVRFLSSDAPSTTGVTYSGTAQLGYVYPGRRVAIVISSISADPVSFTLGGNPATKTCDAGSNPNKFSVWEVDMPTGTTANFSLTFPSNQSRIGLGFYTLANVTGNPTALFEASASGSPVLPVSVSGNQMGIAAFAGPGLPSFATIATPAVWTNAERNWDGFFVAPARTFGGATIPAGSGDISITANWTSGAGARGMFAAVWD